jgi:hypothetical protein
LRCTSNRDSSSRSRISRHAKSCQTVLFLPCCMPQHASVTTHPHPQLYVCATVHAVIAPATPHSTARTHPPSLTTPTPLADLC